MVYIQIISSSNNNMTKTLKKCVQINNPLVRALLGDETYASLKERHPSGRVHFWANASGKNDTNLSKGVDKIPQGTPVYFQSQGKIKYRVTTTINVFENEALADLLWGPKENGDSYRWIFSFGHKERTRKVSVATIGSWMAYKETFKAFRSVTRLQGQKERLFLRAMRKA